MKYEPCSKFLFNFPDPLKLRILKIMQKNPYKYKNMTHLIIIAVNRFADEEEEKQDVD